MAVPQPQFAGAVEQRIAPLEADRVARTDFDAGVRQGLIQLDPDGP